MEIVIIGSGNVAYHLAKAFTQNNIKIKQIFGRNKEDLKIISETNKIAYSNEELAEADFYLICSSDKAINEISKKITKENCLVAHTSGSLPVEILEGKYRKSNFYPLQTFTKNKPLEYSNIPIFLEAENPKDIEFLEFLAEKISNKVMNIDYEQRKYIHLTAVFSCNFVNHLFARAKEISDEQSIPFDYFLPLINETIEKINHLSPKEAQTGPAIRNDLRVLKLHEELIKNDAQLNIYETMNDSIKNMYNLK